MVNRLPTGEIAVGSPGSMARENCELKAEVTKFKEQRNAAIAEMRNWRAAWKGVNDSLAAVAQEKDDEYHRAESASEEVAELKAELCRESQISEGRHKTLCEKADELRSEWVRAEAAESHLERLRQGIQHIRDHAGRHPGESLEAIRRLCDELLS
jgi:chromosome segregation ATPase